MQKKTFITMKGRVALMDFLRKIGQKSIDDLGLSIRDLAERATKEIGEEVTANIVKRMLPDLGLRCSEKLAKYADRLAKGKSAIKEQLDRIEAMVSDIHKALNAAPPA